MDPYLLFFSMFYALCKHYGLDSAIMAHELRVRLDIEYHPLFQKIEAIELKIIDFNISEIFLNTLYFCADNLYMVHPQNNREKLESIVENNQWVILSVTTHNQIIELVRNMQERHSPILVLN